MADPADLERELRDLAAHVEWPDADLVGPVTRRLRQQGGAPRAARPRWPVLRPATAWVALPVVVALVLAVSPSARSTVASWLGVRGERIKVVAHPPTTATARGPARPPDLGLGPAVSLEEAQAAVGINVLVPTLAGLTRPDEVHVARPPTSGEVALVYDARPDLPAAGTTGVGLLISVFRGSLEPGLFQKVLGPDTRLERVQVGKARAYWIEGAPHQFFYMDEHGQIQPQSVRLAANVLLWETRGLTVRVESALPRDPTVRIAESMR